MAAIHDQLGLLGTPTMDGILDHIQGLRCFTRLLERQLHGDPEAAGVSPDHQVTLRVAPSTSGLQGPSHSLTELTCRERSFLRLDSEGVRPEEPVHFSGGSSSTPKVRDEREDSKQSPEPVKPNA